MTILHVTDFHFNQRWFHWLQHHAPPHDLLIMSGDLLDLASPTSQRDQIAWVSHWLSDYPRPLCVCSGQHDLEWDAAEERWYPAYWLRALSRPGLWVDGQIAEVGGFSFLNIGATTRPKGAAADCWIVHAPPSRTLVATRRSGGDAGDPRLIGAVHQHLPLIVFSGHVHAPVHWCGKSGGTLFLNPGHAAAAEFPNHIIVRTNPLSCEFIRARTPAGESAVVARSSCDGESRAFARPFSPRFESESLLTTSPHSLS